MESATSAAVTSANNNHEDPEISNGVSETASTTANGSSDEVYTINLKSLTGTILKLQVSSLDSNIEIKQILAECIETCYITSYELRVGDRILEDFSDISQYPEIKPGSTITMHSANYDDKGARFHVYRLRELLDSRIDDMYLSQGSIEVFAERYVHSFPSFSQELSKQKMPQELTTAVDCDLEFQTTSDIWKQHSAIIKQQISEKKSNSKHSAHIKGNIDEIVADIENRRKSNLKNKKSQQEEDDTNEDEEIETDFEEMYDYDSKRVFAPSVDKAISLQGLERLISASSSKLPKCVNSIVFSGWNPPNGNRKLHGDLFYLQIETLENKIFHITAKPSGFYVNGTMDRNFDPLPAKKSYQSHTLLGLLWEISPLFKHTFPLLLAARTRKHPFEATPVPFPSSLWAVPKSWTKHELDPSRSEETLFTIFGNDPRIQQREWNEEYQSCKELPSGTMEERIIRDRTLFKIHCDFVDAATKGAKAVVDKCLMPINPIDPVPSQVYIQNNIFFSFAVDSKDPSLGNTPKKTSLSEMDHVAYANANNDLKGVIAFNEADIRGIHTLASAIIDYRGYRVIAQSIIPGILQGDQGSKHCYGSIDDGKTFNWSEKFHNLMKEAAEKLNLKEHSVLDVENKEYKLYSPVECKGIVGSDGRFYVLDLLRITPRDANFPNLNTAVLRRELVKNYIRSKLTKYRIEKAKEAKEKSSAETLEDDAPKFAFNPDVFIKYEGRNGIVPENEETAQDEAQVKELATFLKETVIPAFVKESCEFDTNAPIDGASLAETMKEKGINMRYLGEIAKLCENKSSQHLKKLCEQEMMTRAAKIEFSSILRTTGEEKLIVAIEKFLNALFGTVASNTSSQSKKNKMSIEGDKITISVQALRNKLRTSVENKFNYTLPEEFFDKFAKLATLRSFCMKSGLKVICRDYNFASTNPFTAEDIQGIEPVVKHSTPSSMTAQGLLDVGKKQLEMSQLENAYEFLNQAIVMFQQVRGPMNKEVAQCFNLITAILHQASELPQAILHQHKALIINRRVAGIDSAATCHLHQLLGMLCQNFSNNYEFALKHFLRSLYICKLICGRDHPELAVLYMNIGLVYQNMGEFQQALKYLKESHRINEEIWGADHLITGSSQHALAVIHAATGNFRSALKHEQDSYKIFSKNLQTGDIRLKESSEWLKEFTQKLAIQQKNMMSKKDTEETKKMLEKNAAAFTSLIGRELNSGNPPPAEFAEWVRTLQNQLGNTGSQSVTTGNSQTATPSTTTASVKKKTPKKK